MYNIVITVCDPLAAGGTALQVLAESGLILHEANDLDSPTEAFEIYQRWYNRPANRKGDVIAYLDQFEDGDEITLHDMEIMFSEIGETK